MHVQNTAAQSTEFMTTSAARAALGSAVVLGIAAERLLWYGPAGVGLTVWIALFGAGAVLVVRQASFPWLRETAFAAAVAVAGATITAVRASPALHMLAFAVLILAASVPVLRARSLHFGATPVVAQLLGVAVVVAHAGLGGFALLARDVGRIAPLSRRPRLLIAARGALLAAPPLAIFGALFISADPLFEHYARGLTRLVAEDVTARLTFVLAFAWLTAGLLRGLLPQRSPLASLPAAPTIPAAEVSVALGAVVALFTIFVLVQANWLFAGAGAVAATTDLTVADYARRGFFELVAAAALTLPMLLGADAIARPATPAAQRRLRLLSGALVALVLIVMASAIQRMALYTARFGLTELRLYTTAFMIWLGLVFAWFVITTLRGRRRRFTAGPIVAAVVAAFSLAALNPDAVIARVNIERARSGAAVDVNYLNRLSADAVPELMRQLDRAPASARCGLAQLLLKYEGQSPRNWRTVSFSERQAHNFVANKRAALRQVAGQCPAPGRAS